MQLQQALLLVALMRQTSVLPVVVSISASISACEKAQQWQQALGFLAVIHRSAVLPNVISYNAAISACERGKQWQQALRLLELMQQTSFCRMSSPAQPSSVLVDLASLSAGFGYFDGDAAD